MRERRFTGVSRSDRCGLPQHDRQPEDHAGQDGEHGAHALDSGLLLEG